MKTLTTKVPYGALLPKMHLFSKVLWLVLILFFASCDKDSEEIPPEITAPTQREPGLVETLESEYTPLSANPLNWSDSELAFLDDLSTKQVIGMGEATHGTAEFFEAKFRMFRYLVENHGHRLFAIEADFGESLFINEAIQNGSTEDIVDLMRSKMIFWTWSTEEVRALLEWMSEYNKNRPDEEKLQYFGVDAQFNIHNIDVLRNYLQDTNAPFLSFANGILQEAESSNDSDFASYDDTQFESLLGQLDQVRDSIQAYESLFINESTERSYNIHLHLAKVVQQVLQVNFARSNNDFSVSHRDIAMAENTLWVSQLFNDAPVVLWAHNAHVAKDPLFGGAGGAIGRGLQQELGGDYEAIGFLFSQGTFNAVSVAGNPSGLGRQNITVAPKANSLNVVMANAAADNFIIDLPRLNQYEPWGEAYANTMEYFHIGALYNQNPLDYYMRFNPVYYDQMIFLERTTASVFLSSN